MSKQVEHVSDIIKVLKGGIEFYQDAMEKVQQPNVKQMLSKMIAAKEQAVVQLQPYAIAEQGEAETSTSWAVDIRSKYTELLSIFSSDTDHTYVDQLEEVEDKVLAEIDNALDEDQPSDCAQTLRQVRAHMQTCHDEMKALQLATS